MGVTIRHENKKKKGHTAFEGGRHGCARACDGVSGWACKGRRGCVCMYVHVLLLC